MRRPVLVLSFLLLLSMPAAAEAAQRYAGPGETDASPCTQSNPCSYASAVIGANNGDEVIVLPGDYGPIAGAGPFDPSTAVNVHGAVGQPRPRIFVSSGTGLSLTAAASRASDLQFVTSGSGRGLNFGGSVAERITVTGSGTTGGSAGVCTLSNNATLRDSVCATTGAASHAIFVYGGSSGTTTATLRNVTAQATHWGVYAQPNVGGNAIANLTNVIAHGDVRDIELGSSGGADTVTVTASRSNYRFTSIGDCGVPCTFVSGAGGNQDATTSPPAFRDAEFRQANGSPTIDNGATGDDTGRTDPDGKPRTINGTTDIGGYEQTLAPGVKTGDASAVSQTGTTLGGTVDPNLEPTVWRIEYGTTIAYGSATSDGDAGSGDSAQPVGATIGGLAPGTTYHYRLAAISARGTTYGADRTFTTAAAPATTTNPPALPAAGSAFTFRGMTLSKKRVPFRRGVARVRLRCPAAAPARCTGTLRIQARRGLRWVTVARKSFSIAPGTAKTIRLRLKRRPAGTTSGSGSWPRRGVGHGPVAHPCRDHPPAQRG